MASAKISSVLESISGRHCECGICYDRYKDPKILDCQHTFCLQCLQDYIATTNPRSHRVSCPICRSETKLPDTGARGLKTDFRMVSLMEDFARLKLTRSDSGTEKMMTQGVPECPNHKGEAMRFFCTTCQMLICRDCTVVAHCKPEHVYIEAHEAVTKYKESMTELLSPLEGKLEEIEKRLAIISQTKRELSASKHRITVEVQRKAEELKQEITKQAMSIIEGTERVEKRRQQQLDGTKKTLQQLSERIQQSLEITKDMTNIAPDSDFLSLYPTINKDVTLLRDQNTPEVDSSQLGLRFRQGQVVDDINIGEVVTSGRWKLCREFGKEGSGPGEFDYAIGIAARRHDEIAVADFTNNRVQILSVDGTYKCQIPLEKNPRAVALAKQSNRLIVVCKTQVKVFNQDNSLAFEFSTVPQDIARETSVNLQSAAIKKDGNILVGDIHRKVVTEHSPTDGALIRTVPVGIQPLFIAVGSNNKLIISSWAEAVVHVTDGDGTTLFSIKPTIEGQPVLYCSAVWSDHSGLYIPVRNQPGGTGHIHHYDAQGAFLTCIAQGLLNPLGITMTPAGQMAVADDHSVKIYH